MCWGVKKNLLQFFYFTSVGFILDSGSPLVDEGGIENLTVALLGSICGEVEIYFQVSDNNSFTATPGIYYTDGHLQLHA